MDQVPPRLAERLAGAVEPVAPRPASTIILMRQAPGAPEILLLRRPGRSSFAANAWVFPGGAVDEDDGDPLVCGRLLGPDGAWWSGRLGTTEPLALAHVAAALREAWEETGILLAVPAVDPEQLRALRLELLAGGSDLAEVLVSSGLDLDARGLIYIAHWITPEPEPRRFDTRFFLAPVHADSRCDLVGDELREARWIAPRDAVTAFETGELRLLPPTVHTLRELVRYRSVDEVLRSLRSASVSTVVPRMRLEPAGVVIEVVRG